MIAGEVVVRLKAEIASLQAGLSKGAALVKGFASAATAPLRLVQGAFSSIFNLRNIIIGGTIGVTVKKIIDIGAAAEMSERKFTLAFQNMSGSVRAWSEQLGARLKRSADDIRDSAADMFLFMKNTGLTEDSAIGLTKAMTELGYAAEASGRAGGTAADAIWAMRMGMMGNERALRAYSVQIDDNTLKLWAQKHGLDENIKSWTEQQKTYARAGVIIETLAKDLKEVQKQQATTTSLMKQVSDAWKDQAQKIFTKWKPYVDEYFINLRDWLTNNQDTIAKWAGRVGAYVALVGRSIKSFIVNAFTAPKETWDAFLKSLSVMISTAAEMAVTMAIKVGEGIWKGVKQGILGGGANERDINARAMEIFKQKGGVTTKERVFTGSAGAVGGMGYGVNPFVEKEVPVDVLTGYQGQKPLYTYNQALDEARAEILSEQAKAITNEASLTEQLSTALSGASAKLAEIQKSSPSGPDIEKNYAAFRAELKAIEAEIPIVTSEAEKAAEAWSKMWGEANESANNVADATNEAEEGFKNSANTEVLDKFIAGLRAELDILKELNTVRIKGFSAYEQTELYQKQLNKAMQDGIPITDELKVKLKAYAEEMQKLQQQQREASGFLGGLMDVKKELPSLGEALYDLGKNVREGLVDALDQAIWEAKSLGAALDEVGRSVARMFAKQMMNMAVANMSQVAVGFARTAIGGLFGGAGIGATGAPIGMGSTNVSGPFSLSFSRGGIVPNGPVYASSGFFKPKGTDTVPAMLTPGEGVLDEDTTSRLRKVLQVSGGSGDSALTNRMIGLLEKIAAKPSAQVAVVHSKEEIFDVIRSREGLRVIAEANARNA